MKNCHLNQRLPSAVLDSFCTFIDLKMSGAKRKSPYRKSVTTNYLQTNITLEEGDDIAKVVCSRGANLFEIEVSKDEKNGLGLLPNRFKNLIWIKRNDFVIVTIISDVEGVDGTHNSSVKASIPESQISLKRFEIKEILNSENIKTLKTSNKWPSKFNNSSVGTGVKVASVQVNPYDITNYSSDESGNEVTDDEIRDRFGNTISKDDEEEECEETIDNHEPQETNKGIETQIKESDVLGEKEAEVEVEVERISERTYDEYESEEEDDDRHEEYGDDHGEDNDTSTLDVCASDNCCSTPWHVNEILTCSLCSVRDRSRRAKKYSLGLNNVRTHPH